ncbi:hypothetical protein HYH03_017936 [Edaphochlamys debaryana]|uniref:Protein kinase domain-containing protein n=1 Tax=Edaphochlamys debaryana TaxID=47281 RepID=A0A835XHI3_9CHLO|nr:hypothetical protein HYH03_017936 [Edaphochlamys debaryana]|eukprot:KAG2483202.1 hypothetical protein HYH03_017936 [Edaphochlamys debaryana]
MPRSSNSAGLALRTGSGNTLPKVGSLPPCWAQVLDCIQEAVPSSDLGAAVLVPLVFGARRVGSMLLVLPPSGQGQAPFSLNGPGALEALGACVAECCLGPVLPAVEQVAVASSAVASAASLSELATALTSSLSSALSAELHVDLTVRLAVLPYKEAGSGVLFSAADSVTKTGILPPVSPMACASPRSVAASTTRAPPASSPAPFVRLSTHSAAPRPGTPPAHATPMSPGLVGGTASRSQHRSSGAPSGPTASDEDAQGQQSSARGGGGGSRTGLASSQLAAAAAAALAGASGSVAGNPALYSSMPLDSIIGAMQSGRNAALKRGMSCVLGGPTPSQPAVRAAWKACPFTTSSTLLAALLSGKAGAEVGPGDLQLTTTHSSTNMGQSDSVSGVATSHLALRAQVVPDVPAFLHDFERPSNDVFSVVRRAGVAGGLASLVAISAAWTGPAAPLLPNLAGASLESPGGGRTLPSSATVVAAAHRTGGSSGLQRGRSTGCLTEMSDATKADGPGLPALGVYIYSSLPLPQSLLLVARDHAGSLLKMLAPGVIRALSLGPVAEQWAVLAGQTTGGNHAAQSMTTLRVTEGLASHASAGASGGVISAVMPAVASAGGGTGVLQAFVTDSDTGLFQPLVLTTSASHALMSTDLPLVPPQLGQMPPVPAIGQPPLLRMAVAGAAAAAAAAGGSSRQLQGGAAPTLPSPVFAPRGAGADLETPAVSPPVTGMGYILPPPGVQTQSLQSLAPMLGSTGTAGQHGNVVLTASTLLATPPSANNLVGLTSTQNSPHQGPPQSASHAGPQRLNTFLSTGPTAIADHALATGAGALDHLQSTALFSNGGFVDMDGDGDGDIDTEAETLGMLTQTASDLGPIARQQQMATLVTAFTTTLARARNDTEVQGSAHAEDDIRALTISRPIGQGGCSVVMLGRLHSMPVAVKVILPLDDEEDDDATTSDERPTGRGRSQLHTLWSGPVRASQDSGPSDDMASKQSAQARAAAARGTTVRRRQQLQALMRGARELAVLTSISHPNIVQVYSYCTRVVVGEVEPGGGQPRLDVVPEATQSSSPLCTALIMEYCDMGSLADAIDSGMFVKAAKRAASGLLPPNPAAQAPPATATVAGTPAMRAVYLTLLEVALALRHLHSMNLVHCDVKPANVLLRSSATDPRGFTAKLTDFGFVNLVSSAVDSGGEAGNGESSPQEPVGTVTHMAPELFFNGRAVDSSIDCYAFGVLMWEAYTGRAPYPEFADAGFADVPQKVAQEGMRPRFPSSTPSQYRSLAQECWSAAPSQRPSAASLVVRLQALLDASCGSAAGLSRQSSPLATT